MVPFAAVLVAVLAVAGAVRYGRRAANAAARSAASAVRAEWFRDRTIAIAAASRERTAARTAGRDPDPQITGRGDVAAREVRTEVDRTRAEGASR